MASGTSFKQQCPSCEAMVPIRDPGLVGRKIDCPKCKYRFVVKEPEEPEETDEDDKPVKKTKPGAKGAAKSGAKAGSKGAKAGRRRDEEEDDRPKKSGKILITGVVLAGVALAAIIVCVLAWPSGDSPKTTAPVVRPPGQSAPGTGTVAGPGGVKPAEDTSVVTNVTNLLPNKTQVVISYPMNKTLGSSLKYAALEAGGAFKAERLQKQFGFGLEDISRIITGMSIKENWVFTVVQTKKPYRPETIKAVLRLKAEPKVRSKTGKVYDLFLINRELDSLGNLLLKVNQPRDKFAVYFHDATTVIFADPAPLRTFLEEDAKPEILTKRAPPAPPAGAKPKPGAPGTPPGPGRPPAPAPGTPGAPATPGAPLPPPPPPGSYITIPPALKVMLDKIEKVEENKTTRKKEPASVVTIVGESLPLTSLAAKDKDVPAFLLGILSGSKTYGVSLVNYDQNTLTLTVGVEGNSNDSTRNAEASSKQLMPLALSFLKANLGLNVTMATPPTTGNAGAGGQPPPPPPAPPPAPAPGDPAAKKEDGKITLTREDSLLIGTLDAALTNEAYARISLIVETLVIQLKGMAELTSNRLRVHELAAATQAYFQKNGAFPRGTMPRGPSPERGLDWRPDQRLSWMAALLPFLGAEFEEWKLDQNLGWNEGENLKVALRVVPQLLVPSATDVGPPQITYPGMPGVPLGATHFVGMMGVGLEAAEYVPGNPATDKKRGVFGYERVTRKEDIKDGLDQTIVLILVRGDHKAPWLAGGGATLRAVSDAANDTRPVAPFVCMSYPSKPDLKTKYDGKRGTLAIMADGKVRFIPEDIPAATFRALCTIAGGEKIDKLKDLCPVIEDDEDRDLKAETPVAPVRPAPVTPPKPADSVKPPAASPAPKRVP